MTHLNLLAVGPTDSQSIRSLIEGVVDRDGVARVRVNSSRQGLTGNGHRAVGGMVESRMVRNGVGELRNQVLRKAPVVLVGVHGAEDDFDQVAFKLKVPRNNGIADATLDGGVGDVGEHTNVLFLSMVVGCLTLS